MQIPKIEQVAAVLALAPKDQPWRNEGPARHLIRRMLCAQGAKWWHADRTAFALVARARIRIGVRQPGGWDADTDLSSWIGTAGCLVCDRMFIPRHTGQLYCCARCRWRAERIRAMPVALTRCARCSAVMETTRALKKYCSSTCRSRAFDERFVALEGRSQFRVTNAQRLAERKAGDRANPRHCANTNCGKRLTPGLPRNVKFCSPQCRGAAWARLNHARKKLNGHAKPNGHAHATNGHAAEARPDDAGNGERAAQDRAGAGAGEARATDLDGASAATRGAATVG